MTSHAGPRVGVVLLREKRRERKEGVCVSVCVPPFHVQNTNKATISHVEAHVTTVFQVVVWSKLTVNMVANSPLPLNPRYFIHQSGSSVRLEGRFLGL